MVGRAGSPKVLTRISRYNPRCHTYLALYWQEASIPPHYTLSVVWLGYFMMCCLGIPRVSDSQKKRHKPQSLSWQNVLIKHTSIFIFSYRVYVSVLFRIGDDYVETGIIRRARAFRDYFGDWFSVTYTSRSGVSQNPTTYQDFSTVWFPNLTPTL